MLAVLPLAEPPPPMDRAAYKAAMLRQRAKEEETLMESLKRAEEKAKAPLETARATIDGKRQIVTVGRLW